VRILIAEDEEGIMTIYKLSLGSAGHQLSTASDGEECIRLFDSELEAMAKTTEYQSQSAPFGLVMLDYRMPKKNGIEVAEHILSVAPSQKILIASAYIRELTEIDRISNKSGMILLQKPFEIDTLMNLVEGIAAKSVATRSTSGECS
jgi:CheY-like chemotaxis protein